VIPEGEYGGGTVMVWDTGTYENTKKINGKIVPMDECLKDGHIEIMVHGKKLQGGYALVRFKGREKQWLCIKMKDEYARSGADITTSKPKSALTGRTMQQIAAAGLVYDGDCSSMACSHTSKVTKPTRKKAVKKTIGKSDVKKNKRKSAKNR
jgi:ATP-dependent DNA ligase